MELMCPSCMKKLIIEDQYAGQMMKCPLCGGTFTAPDLPAYPGGAPENPTAPPPQPQAPQEQVASGPPPQQNVPRQPPSPPPERESQTKNRFEVLFSPAVLQWIPAGTLFLIFILTFFPWARIGHTSQTTLAYQNGWQVAFGGRTTTDLVEDIGEKVSDDDEDDIMPGPSAFMVIYILLLFPALILAIAVPVLDLLNVQIPPPTGELINSYRWVATGGLILLMFLCLFFQLLIGLGIESASASKIQEKIDEQESKMKELDMPRSLRNKAITVTTYMANALFGTSRGGALSLVFWLHFLGVVAAALMTWIDIRKTAPIPRLEVKW